MTMIKSLIEASDFLNEHKDEYTSMPFEVFLPIFCMIAEEYCKANDRDMVALMETALGLAKEVNNELGKY